MILAILFAIRAQFLMGTVCEINAENSDAAFAEAARIEAVISTWRDDSELSRVNRGEITHPSPELAALLREAMKISEETGGAFDPTVGRFTLPHRPLSASPRAATGSAEPPSQPRGGSDDPAAAQRDHPPIDEGGFGKGYALDRMLALTQGDAVINFGGQIAVRGTHEVAIAHPLHRDQPLVTLTLRDASLSTSSQSEHKGHILDPATGRPVPAYGSVSVIDPSALRADALSTALYVMGPERGLAWARAHNVIAIFISNSGEVKWSRKP